MNEGATAEPRSTPRSSEPAPTSSSGGAPPTNFEYDDNEWDVGIGDLIIDLDADIEKNNDASPACAAAAGSGAAEQRMGVRQQQQHSTSMEKGLKMKIKRTSKPGRSSEAKHEIVQVDNKVATAVAAAAGSVASETTAASAAAKAVGKRAVHKKDHRDKESVSVKAARGEDGVRLDDERAVPAAAAGEGDSPVTAAAEGEHDSQVTAAVSGESDSPVAAPSPQAKRHKTDVHAQSVSDMCVGTDGHISQGTLLEPDRLGPCEPGTTVNLEGIVWQETQGGVLVVNVTWRGKTYVGTLLDYTKHHDWAPPRFNDSPTAELESRGGKGRGKRGRGASIALESAAAETRASVQSKLRSQSKGRRGTANSASANFTAPASPVKRKGRAADREPASADKTPNKRSRTSSNTSQSEPASSAPGTPEPAPASPAATLPTAGPAPLIECPESGCSKKYRHVNGLKYHQSHAHSNGLGEVEREMGESSAPESPPVTKTPPPVSAAVTAPQTPPASPPPVSSAAAPATSPVTPTTPAPAAPPVAASAPPNGAAAPCKPAGPVSAAGAPQSRITEPVGPPLAASETPAGEPRPTHAKVQISDSKGNVKTSGVLRFGPSALPAVVTGAGTGPTVLTSTPQPLRTAAAVNEPAAAPVAVSRPAAASVTGPVPSAARTVPLVAAVDAARYKPKSVSARVATTGLPVVTIPPAGGSYGQTVSHLKPIQPKPTILGETSAINPALEALRKDKERPKKRRKENGVRTPEASPRSEGTEGAARTAVPVPSPGAVLTSGGAPAAPSANTPAPPVVSGAAPVGLSARAPPAASGAHRGTPSGAAGPTERPSRDGTASPAYSDISDDGGPVDTAAAGAGAGAGAGDKKEPAGPPPPSSVYYHSFFQPPAVYVPPHVAGKTGAGPDGADGKDGVRGAAPAAEYPGGQVPYYSYPYLAAAPYPYPPVDPAGYPLPVLVDPKYKVAPNSERPTPAGGPGGEPARTSAPPAEPGSARTGTPSGRVSSPQPVTAHRPPLATPPRAGSLPAPRGALPLTPASTSARGPASSAAVSLAPPPTATADKRSTDAAALAARAAAFGYAPFGLSGLAGLPYGPALLNGGHPARLPVSSAAAPEDLSRATSRASDRPPPAPGAAHPAPAPRLLETQDRTRPALCSVVTSSAAGRAGSPGGALPGPLRLPLPAGLGFPPPGGYTPYTGVPGAGSSQGFAPIK